MDLNLNTSRLNELLVNLQEITDLKFSLHDLMAQELYTVNQRSKFCDLICSTKDGYNRCYTCDLQAVSSMEGKTSPYQYRCHAGLVETAIPVTENGQLVVVILFGQILDNTPLDEQWRNTSNLCKWYKNQVELQKAFLQLPQLFQLEQTISLGELDPSKILEYREEYLEKVLAAQAARRICNGHAIGLNAQELNIYATGRLSDDHEPVTFEELLDRMRVGIVTLIREGSSERNVDRLMQGVVDNQLATENLMFCTDDKHVNDIFREGHISYNVQRAIDLRLEPLDAIKMATINAAKHFHLEHEIGSLTPGRFADVVLLKDLRKIKPEIVFKGGKIVSENGKSLPVSMKEYPDHLFNTVQLKDPITPERFQIAANGERARCKVIALIKDQIINDEIQAWLKIEDGFLAPDLENDILKMAVVERYGKNGNVSTALVRGFGLKSGAIASSVSHDHHNIVVVGTNDADMACAVNAVAEMQGGFAACSNGEKVAELGLPLAGLMSVLPAREVMAKMDQVNAAARALGSPLAAPFMTLSFVSLPTVPKLGLTDLGLVDVLSHKLTDLILETE